MVIAATALAPTLVHLGTTVQMVLMNVSRQIHARIGNTATTLTEAITVPVHHSTPVLTVKHLCPAPSTLVRMALPVYRLLHLHP